MSVLIVADREGEEQVALARGLALAKAMAVNMRMANCPDVRPASPKLRT